MAAAARGVVTAPQYQSFRESFMEKAYLKLHTRATRRTASLHHMALFAQGALAAAAVRLVSAPDRASQFR